MFHNFKLTNTKTGTVHHLTQIGATPKDAEQTLRKYNFAGLDWTNRKLEYVPENKNGVVTEYCGCRFDWNSKFTESYCPTHQADAAEMEREEAYWHSAA